MPSRTRRRPKIAYRCTEITRNVTTIDRPTSSLLNNVNFWWNLYEKPIKSKGNHYFYNFLSSTLAATSLSLSSYVDRFDRYQMWHLCLSLSVTLVVREQRKRTNTWQTCSARQDILSKQPTIHKIKSLV